MTGGPLLLGHPDCLLHRAPDHPERPERIAAIQAAIAADARTAGLEWAEPPPATVEELEAAHLPGYVEALLGATRRADDEGRGGWIDPDTWLGPGSGAAALASAGGAVEAVRRVLGGERRSALSLTRPPGHHATREVAMGFCLFNNVAVAACAALAAGLERVAIVDFDVHHGNGTQDVFWERGDVLYVSTHQWPLYPGTGAASERGRGDGEGLTLNLPLPAGSGEAEYLQVFDAAIAPALRAHRPELILVSAGFDAHRDDPLAGMALTSAAYARLARRILDWSEELCAGRTAWVLEGGYNLDALAGSVVAVLAEIAGS
jgi:acetoin utilization deacetylase AcuC-like enzyme